MVLAGVPVEFVHRECGDSIELSACGTLQMWRTVVMGMGLCDGALSVCCLCIQHTCHMFLAMRNIN